MARDRTALETKRKPVGRNKARLLTLDHLDGRTTAVKRVREVEAEIASDMGGSERLSEAQRALARRAAVLSAVLEDSEVRWAQGEDFNVRSYTAACNTLRRVLVTLGLERRMRDATPTLGEYLGAKGAA